MFRSNIPKPDVLRSRLESGLFQFYPLGHAELPEDCTGETIIPRSYLERRYDVVDFTESVPLVDQAVVTLRRRA